VRGRLLGLVLLGTTLASCSQPRGLSFVQPAGGASVSGTIAVVLKAAEPNPGRVELYGNGLWLGETVREGAEYHMNIDASRFPEGKLILRAVPEAGLPVETAVKVSAGGSGVAMPGGNQPGSKGDPLNQNGILGLLPAAAATPIGDAFYYMPQDFPWVKLYAPLLKAGLGQMLASTQVAVPAALPRGVFTFDDLEQTWVFEDTEAGTIEITWNYLDPIAGEPHDVKLNLIWDQDGPTTTVLGLTGPLEVPTRAWFFFQDNETDIVSLELSFDWFKPDMCDTPILIPETLEVVGWLLEPREATFPEKTEASGSSVAPQQTDGDDGDNEPDDTFENTGVYWIFNFEDDPQGKRVFTHFYTTAVTEQGAEVELRFLLDAKGPVVIEGCDVLSFAPEAFSLLLSSLVGPEDGARDGTILNLNFLDLIFDGLSVPSRATIDRAELTTVEQDVGRDTLVEDGEVTFDAGRGFSVTGTAQLPSGATVPLDEYLKTLFETYRPWFAGNP